MADAEDTGELSAAEPARKRMWTKKRRKGRKLSLDIQRLPDESKADYLRRYGRERYAYLKANDPNFLAENAAKTTAYGQANPEIVKQRKLAEVARNAAKYRQRATKWYQEHPEQAAQTRRARYLANKAQVNAASKEWREANPEARRAIAENYRSRKMNAAGSFTADDIKAIERQQKGRCALCRGKLPKRRAIDHIMPLSRGGTNDARNLQLVCFRCNTKKGAKHPLTYARELGLLL